ncbi:MAG TPA: ATPase, T2SS/T4P/T4SS family [Candidatus Dormibacteraeota bacterium]|nr:ATPase, T2SS/T4P/T4SS family [Candidatus Dormibacteraeota bacterium]
MASNPVQAPRPAEPALRLGERLLAEKLLNESQLYRALELQQQSSRLLGAVLLDLGILDEDRLTAVLSEHLEVPLADLRRDVVDVDAAQLVPADFARRNVLLPIARQNGELTVAMADPGNVHVVNDLRLITGLDIAPRVAGRSDILANLSRVHSMRPRIQEAALSLQDSRAQFETTRSIVFELSNITATSPAVEIVNMLITQGLRDRASDIHIEPQKDYLRIRFRIDGVLQDVAHLPTSTGAVLASRIKIMAEMNIVERRRAQDGQISLTVDGRDLDVRVATIETIWGEKLVMRLLDRGRSLINLEQLGFSHGGYEKFHTMLHSPYGMIIVSGPTGSGKTTTLYAAIHELDKNVRNIMTIEDPVEYTFENINQSQINKLADISFANGLRAILRQDPDIILVGEIRDRETAEIAVQSALTGHLVLSSLHATDAAGALLRFTDMGIEGFLIASSVIAIVAQRLVRQICDGCKTTHRATLEEIRFAESLGLTAPDVLYHGQGCARCNHTGYFDRIGVFEVLTMTDRLKRMVIDRASHRDMMSAALEEGVVPLKLDAWQKAAAGVTTVPEALRSVYIL